MNYLYDALGWIMDGCYALCRNYGLAIILFTLVSKIVLLPVTLWTYFNSITMLKIQPAVNMLKIKYYGQPDIIAEEQAKLFKEKKYHPLASTIPVLVQLVLLIGVVGVIRMGIDNPAIDMSFGPVNLGQIPSEHGLELIWSPLIAGLSAWLLCIYQNKANVLQAEQSKLNQYGTIALSVGLSLYLGWFVPVGTAFYWVCSNLFTILQLFIMNCIFKPGKRVDYEALNKSRDELAALQSVGKKKGEGFFSPVRRRERQDYKRFFSVVNKHLVFYSEGNGFYKYLKGYVEYILDHTNITIHYITSDPEDRIFDMAEKNDTLRAYYIGENKLITLMMKMDADIVVMTMPDLETYHIKRSLVRKDVEYVFVQHDMNSHAFLMRKGCVDHFDTVFCTGPHQLDEILETEKLYNLPAKNLVKVGYPLIDDIRAAYGEAEHKTNSRKKILIAPSWQKDNIIDSCLDELLEQLKSGDYDIIVRPHPQEVRLKHEYMEQLKKRFCEYPNIEIQTDFTSNNPIMEADLLITDWSGISWEYAFTTYRPVLFINTPMKIMNPDYEEIKTPQLNLVLRDEIGVSLSTDDLSGVKDTVDRLISDKAGYETKIRELGDKYIYNPGKAAETGSKYIIESLQNKISARKGK